MATNETPAVSTVEEMNNEQNLRYADDTHPYGRK